LGEIKIGICSWTEPTLVKGGKFYPAWANSAEKRLLFYSNEFPLVEVDSSYYGLPVEKTSALWVHRTPDQFVFDIKAFRLFTQHPTSPEVLPKETRDVLPPELLTKKNLYFRDLPRVVIDDLWKSFEQALLPLDSAGKLGVVLFQFPSWFYPGNEQRDYIAYCRAKLPQYNIAVEFRHNSWLNARNLDRTLSFLKENHLSYVSVDEPQGFDSSVPPLAEATADIGVIRFHGRNARAWEKGALAASGRFNYLYSDEELKEWIPKVKLIAEKTRQLHVLFNTCYDDQAIRNARQFRQLFI
jgi:uncharacterized protein YecE (DUF72 family)